MPFTTTDDTLDTLGAALSGGYVLLSEDGTVRIITASLRGDAVAAAAAVDGQLTVIVDLAKPNAHAHARTLLRGSGWRVCDLPEGTELDIPEPISITRLAFAGPALPHRGLRLLRPPLPAAGVRSGRRWS